MRHNRDRFQGFLAGILTSALALGLGSAALAAGRSIQIDDGVTVTVNGARFSPRNVRGEEVPLFSYDGTTYAPVRALCEAAGMTVDYDSTSRTARITTGDMALAADPNVADYIAAEKARELALRHAGVAAADAVFLQTKLDREDGKVCYDVEFYCGNTEYDYDIDAVTGSVLGFDHDLDCYDIHYAHGSGHHQEEAGHHGSAASAGDLIPQAEAQAIALGRAPQGARVVKCELDRDDGRYVYEVELREGPAEYECDINAVTGVILKWEVDYD